jgi:hypothetical protein
MGAVVIKTDDDEVMGKDAKDIDHNATMPMVDYDMLNKYKKKKPAQGLLIPEVQ